MLESGTQFDDIGLVRDRSYFQINMMICFLAFGRTATNWAPPNNNKIQTNNHCIDAINRVIKEAEAEA